MAQNLRLDRERTLNMLTVVSKDIEKNFYDPTLKGLDWKALTAAAQETIKNANTSGEMVTAIFSLVDRLHDSHTQFDPPSRVTRPLFGFSAKAFGDDVRIYQIKAKSAADKAGLRLGDRIVSINGFNAERNSFDLMMLYFHRLRPAPALKIVYQHGSDAPQTLILSAKVKQEPAIMDLTTETNIWRYLEEFDEERHDHSYMFDDGIAFFEVTDFAREEVGIIHTQEKPKAVVVDLRGNPGGYEDAVLELAGHFEPQPTTMGEQVDRKKTQPLKIKPQKPNLAVPVVVLIDSRTASGGEMLARHLQRTGRAVIIGDQSSGRVNASRYFSEQIGVEKLVPFGVQISVAKIVFPGGEELEKRGVTPDIRCVPSGEDIREHRDPCLKQAIIELRKKLNLSGDLPKKTADEIDSVVTELATQKQQLIDRQPD